MRGRRDRLNGAASLATLALVGLAGRASAAATSIHGDGSLGTTVSRAGSIYAIGGGRLAGRPP